jgi:hypothetical protein
LCAAGHGARLLLMQAARSLLLAALILLLVAAGCGSSVSKGSYDPAFVKRTFAQAGLPLRSTLETDGCTFLNGGGEADPAVDMGQLAVAICRDAKTRLEHPLIVVVPCRPRMGCLPVHRDARFDLANVHVQYAFAAPCRVVAGCDLSEPDSVIERLRLVERLLRAAPPKT